MNLLAQAISMGRPWYMYHPQTRRQLWFKLQFEWKEEMEEKWQQFQEHCDQGRSGKSVASGAAVASGTLEAALPSSRGGVPATGKPLPRIAAVAGASGARDQGGADEASVGVGPLASKTSVATGKGVGGGSKPSAGADGDGLADIDGTPGARGASSGGGKPPPGGDGKPNKGTAKEEKKAFEKMWNQAP